MNVRIFWVHAMKCMCAQTRPRFILSSERVLGGMEFEPMLTPREKSPLPENFPRGGSNPRRCGQRAQTLPTSYSGPLHWLNDASHIKKTLERAANPFNLANVGSHHPEYVNKLQECEWWIEAKRFLLVTVLTFHSGFGWQVYIGHGIARHLDLLWAACHVPGDLHLSNKTIRLLIPCPSKIKGQ